MTGKTVPIQLTREQTELLELLLRGTLGKETDPTRIGILARDHGGLTLQKLQLAHARLRDIDGVTSS